MRATTDNNYLGPMKDTSHTTDNNYLANMRTTTDNNYLGPMRATTDGAIQLAAVNTP